MGNIENTENKIMTIKKFSEVTGIGQSTIRRLVHSRDFPAFRTGNRWRIEYKSAMEYFGKAAAEKADLRNI